MKIIFSSILIAGLLIIMALVYTNDNDADRLVVSTDEQASKENVFMENGKQIVEITARGGYSPRVSEAKALIPTIIRMNTIGSLDCSSALSLPSIKYRQNLPMKGKTDIEIPPQKAGAKFRGLCAMGMYSFVINFN